MSSTVSEEGGLSAATATGTGVDWKPTTGPAPTKAIELKESGNKEFGAGNVAEAAEIYRQALGVLAAVAQDHAAAGHDSEDAKENSSPAAASSDVSSAAVSGCEPVKCDALAVVLYSNLAACYLRLEQPSKALVECDAAVAINPSHVKAAYRRAQALERLGRVQEALEAFRDLVSTVPAAKEGVTRSKNLVQVAKLPQSRDGWLCVAGPMHGWVRDRGLRPSRPWALCVVRCEAKNDEEDSSDDESGASAGAGAGAGAGATAGADADGDADADADASGKKGKLAVKGMLSHKKLPGPPTADDVVRICLDAVARSKARPATVVFQAADFEPKSVPILDESGCVPAATPGVAGKSVGLQASPLLPTTRLLQGLGVKVKHESDLFDTSSFMRYISARAFPEDSANQMAPLLSIPGMSAPQLKSLFHGAADWYKLTPWEFYGAEDLLSVTVTLPGEIPSASPKYVCVLGQGGSTFGLTVETDLDAFRPLLQGKRPAEGRQMKGFFYAFPDGVNCFADLDDAATYQWPVASERAFPNPYNVKLQEKGSGMVSRPSADEMLWYDAALRGLAAFHREEWSTVAKRGRGLVLPASRPPIVPRSLTTTVQTFDGPRSVHIVCPVVLPEGHSDAESDARSGSAAGGSLASRSTFRARGTTPEEDAQRSLLTSLANGRMEEVLNPAKFEWPSTGDADLDAAQALVRESARLASSPDSTAQRIELAKEAMKRTPRCADAYLDLADLTCTDLETTIAMLEEGLEAGRWAVEGEAAAKDANVSAKKAFSSMHARPYLRVLYALSGYYGQLAQYNKSLDAISAILDLDARDPLEVGVQVPALAAEATLLAEGGSGSGPIEAPACPSAPGLLEKIGSLHGVLYSRRAKWAYGLALYNYLTSPGAAADDGLVAAFSTNIHVPEFLLGRMALPTRAATSMAQPGGLDEAMAVAWDLHSAFSRATGAKSWLETLWDTHRGEVHRSAAETSRKVAAASVPTGASGSGGAAGGRSRDMVGGSEAEAGTTSVGTPSHDDASTIGGVVEGTE